MSKKGTIVGIIVIFAIILAVIFAIYMINKNNNNNQTDSTTNGDTLNIEDEEEKNTEGSNNVYIGDEGKKGEKIKNSNASKDKILVVYYSAQNHTRQVAKKISEKLNADIFEIVPENVYTAEDLDWTNSNSRVSKEHDDESLRNVKLKTTKVENFEDYDTVLIGYPIWWGVAAWPVDTFVKENDFKGKTVIPFCTSVSSGLGQSENLLKNESNDGDWKKGHRFSENPSDLDISRWTDSIK